MSASPVRGELGIVVIPESQAASLLLSQWGSADNYRYMAAGAYRFFFDRNIQADYVHIYDIAEYRYLYLPYPLMLKKQTAQALSEWVGAGGHLICEGCPAYFGDHGHVSTVQPGFGLDRVFGALQEYVEFTPDLLDGFAIQFGSFNAYGSEYVQAYRPITGEVRARLGSGKAIAVENRHGDGRALLIGTCLSKGYFDHPGSGAGALIESVLAGWGMGRLLSTDNDEIKIRLQQSGSRVFAWMLNPAYETQTAEIRFSKRLGARGIRRSH